MSADVLSQAKPDSTTIWWRSKYVWLLLSGPIVVIIAGIVTLYLAISRPDPVIYESVPSARVERNHAATGVPKINMPLEKKN